MKSGYPRLARWDKLKQKVENVSLILDSAEESFSWDLVLVGGTTGGGFATLRGDKEGDETLYGLI
jgi:hypothetical protein